MRDYLKITLLFVISILLIVLIPGLDGSYIKTSKLYINEVLASNKYTLLDDDFEDSDYIEIYNGYNYDIDLTGYHLSDNEYEPKKWSFPNVVVKSKSYLIIYASGKDRVEIDKNIIHTNFKLSSLGETIVFSDKENNIINKITYSEGEPDISYGYSKGKYFLMKPTPGYSNVNYEYKRLNVDLTNKIIINEYMTSNKRYNYDSYGNYYDWIELANITDNDITLRDVYLSDNLNKLNKFKLPEVTIKSKGHLLVYLSEDEKHNNEEIHANFRLSKDEDIILSDGKNVFDKVRTFELDDNISYGLFNGEWYYFASPTPGGANNTKAISSIKGDINGDS